MRLLSAAGALALLTISAPAAPALAADSLGAFSLAANAPAVQVRVAEPSLCFSTAAANNGCQGVIPEAVSTLRSGPLGHSLAAVAWPGDIAANAGSLILVAGGSNVPPQVTAANDPVKAEAYNNTGAHTVSDDQVPGSTMCATAYDDRTSATGSVQQSQVLPIGSFGKTTGTSEVHLDGPGNGVASSHSEVQDVSLAGVVTIGAVSSDATASTDGKAATAKGSTRVSDMAVAGIPVTVDEQGVHVSSAGVPTKGAQDSVNAALKAAGITIAMSPAQGKPQGAAVSYSASSLVIVWNSPGAVESVVLGGANVSVAAGTALVFPIGGPPTPLPVVTGPVPHSGTGAPGSTVIPGTPGDPGSPGQQPTVQQPTPTVPILSALGLDVPLPALPWLAGIIGALATVSIAAGLKRLPDRVLERAPDETC